MFLIEVFNTSLGGSKMYYLRKLYIVKSDFVETFNDHFNKTNLPNQLKHGASLVGRWMRDKQDSTVET